MKSCGPAPTFLALSGLEPVRSIGFERTDDHEAGAYVTIGSPSRC